MSDQETPDRALRARSQGSGRTRSGGQRLQRANLPSLKGVPTGRREYTYGSSVEPLPTRPGRGLDKGDVLDLRHAVQNALHRHSDEAPDETALDLPAADEDEEDELARNPAPPRPRIAGSLPPNLTTNQAAGSSDVDDDRSFGLESDLFGDTSMNSTPGRPVRLNNPRAPAPPAPAPAPEPAPAVQPKRTAALSQPEPAPLSSPPAPVVQPNNPTAPSRPQPAPLWNTRKERPRAPGPNQPEAAPEPLLRRVEPEDERASRIPPIVESRARLRTHVLPTEPAAASRRTAPRISPEPLSSSRLKISEGPRNPSPDPPRHRRHEETTELLRGAQGLVTPNKLKPLSGRGGLFASPYGQGAGVERPLVDSTGGLLRTQPRARPNGLGADVERPLFNHPGGLPGVRNEQPASLVSRRRGFPSDHSEQDDAVQQEIQRDLEQEEHEERQEARQRARQAWLDSYHRWLAGLGSMPSHAFLTLRSAGAAAHDSVLSWCRYLNPWNLVVWIFQSLATIFAALSSGLPSQSRVVRALRGIACLLISAVVSAILLSIAVYLVSHLKAVSDQSDYTPLTTLSGLRNKAGNFMGQLFSGDDRASDLWDFDGDVSPDLRELLKPVNDAIKDLRSGSQLNAKSIKQLEANLGDVVYMEVQNGKPVIDQTFWHAILERAHQDDTIYTSDAGGKLSGEQLRALTSQMVHETIFTSEVDSRVSRLEGRVDDKIKQWADANEDRIASLTQSQLDSTISSSELEKNLQAQVQTQLEKHDGVLVSRNDFLQHVQEALNESSRSKTQAGELVASLEEIKQELRRIQQDRPDTTNRAETKLLVERAVQESIARLDLKALAQGNIQSHFDSVLDKSINYFGIGSGATIDVGHTSPLYQRVKRSTSWFDPPGPRPQITSLVDAKPNPPIVALRHWTEAGECFCGARDKSKRGNFYGVVLSVQLGTPVIPQHIVLEHIIPSATTDPGAMPKDIEVWALIEDDEVRERVRDFASAKFMNEWKTVEERWDETEPDFGSQNFVKIGEFSYESDQLRDGRFVHRLDQELVNLDAATDQVIIRAVSNHGAEDHTCFYRVRMYGQATKDKVV